jgi:hypothetical protein
VLTGANLLVIGQCFVTALTLLGNLTKVVIGRTLVLEIKRDQVFELFLGECRIVFLQCQDGHRENHVRIVRVGEQQLLELTPGLAVTLFSHQHAGELQLSVARTRMTFDETLQRSDGLGGRLFGQYLRLQQGGSLPVRALRERLARFSECLFLLVRSAGSHGDGVMGFGETEEWLARLADQLQDRLPIRAAGKHPVECQEVGRQRILVRLKQANQLRCQPLQLIGHDQDTDQDLLRALGVGLDLNPQAGEFEHQIQTTRVTGHLNGPLQDCRVAGAHSQIRVGLAGEFCLASLQGHFGKQDLIDHLSAQLAVVLGVGGCLGPGGS